MEAAQEMEGQEMENLGNDVMESLGETESNQHRQESGEFENQGDGNHSHAVNHAQKRINARNRERDRQLQYMQQRIAELESRMTQPEQSPQHQPGNPYSEPHANGNSGMEEHIH